MKLYELGRLTSGQAASLAGIPRVAFLLLPFFLRFFFGFDGWSLDGGCEELEESVFSFSSSSATRERNAAFSLSNLSMRMSAWASCLRSSMTAESSFSTGATHR